MTNTFEKEYVYDVYNHIALNFNDTRYKIWDGVTRFLDSLNPNDIVLDAGCGNGKNMLYRSDLQMFGCDASSELIKICRTKNLDVVNANIVNLPYRNCSFDSVICVAVLHHLSKKCDRIQSIKEMIRVLKPNGKLYIEVWSPFATKSQEEPIDTKFTKIEDIESTEYECPAIYGDFMVKWNHKFDRYYHFFDENELNKLFIEISNAFERTKVLSKPLDIESYSISNASERTNVLSEPNITIIENKYECGNWCVIVKKNF
jgi:alkylated DNA repair protein alkB homolog 8